MNPMKMFQKPPPEQEHWLGFIPVQVGPASAHARTVTHWMLLVLTLQVTAFCLQLFWFNAFIASFWTGLLCAAGIYAWKQDMNITFISLWGVGCLLNGLADTLGLIFPLIFDILLLSWVEIPFRAFIPVAELIGAAFAWHLYIDYYRTGGGAMGKFLEDQPLFDPMGNLVSEVDPADYSSLKAGLAKQGGILREDFQKGGYDKKFADLEKTMEAGVTQRFQGLQAGFQQGVQHGMQEQIQAGVSGALAGAGLPGLQEGMRPQTKRKQNPCC